MTDTACLDTLISSLANKMAQANMPQQDELDPDRSRYRYETQMIVFLERLAAASWNLTPEMKLEGAAAVREYQAYEARTEAQLDAHVETAQAQLKVLLDGETEATQRRFLLRGLGDIVPVTRESVASCRNTDSAHSPES